ncbi:hypothetical protein VUR80DRAFT_5178 [Thermomyces stellatus]
MLFLGLIGKRVTKRQANGRVSAVKGAGTGTHNAKGGVYRIPGPGRPGNPPFGAWQGFKGYRLLPFLDTARARSQESPPHNVEFGIGQGGGSAHVSWRFAEAGGSRCRLGWWMMMMIMEHSLSLLFLRWIMMMMEHSFSLLFLRWMDDDDDDDDDYGTFALRAFPELDG